MNTRVEKKPSLSDELTVIFLRANGSPRSFRVPVRTLQRSALTLSLVFVASLVLAVLLFGINIVTLSTSSTSIAPKTYSTKPATEPAVPATTPEAVPPSPPPALETTAVNESANTNSSTGIWSKLTGAVKPAADAGGEQEKELSGLRDDIAKLNQRLESRKDIETGNSSMIQFMAPTSTLINLADQTMKVENIKVSRDDAKAEYVVDFELHNIDPKQRQARGYIVVLAKNQNALTAYPQNVFSPNQNILLSYTKGETFAVSRFRQARANIPMIQNTKGKVDFQILLFGTDGKVLNSIHIEENI